MTGLRELIVLSLEPWDEVRRRNQLLLAALGADLPELKVLFVEPPMAGLRDLRRGRRPHAAVRRVESSDQITVLRPVEWRPDRLSPHIPPTVGRTVRSAAKALEFRAPLIWVNNHSLARFALGSGWPVVYDITDDWLLSDIPAAMRRRAELDDRLLMQAASAVVVCSPALAASRGARRDVVLIPNGVDLAHFTTPQPRPKDLGAGPVAVYVGTLHDERLDLQLCCDLADAFADVHFVYVGPDSLRADSHARLASRSNVSLLGPRPYAVVPAYLQHADAVFIPHLISPFTESLDPIKARECLAVGRPTIATPVAGFRDLGPPVRAFSAADFATGLRELLDSRPEATVPADVWTWTAAARRFRTVLEAAIR